MAITEKDIGPRAIISTDVSAEVHQALKAIARRNQRSVAGEVRYLLEQHVEANRPRTLDGTEGAA